MKAAEREVRDADILRLFIAGSSYRQIARAVNVSLTTVHRVVQKQLAAGAKRRELLSDEALAIHTERTERLFQAHWTKALSGDHRSAELCRRILAQQARLQEAELTAQLPAPTPTAGMSSEDDEEPQDELSKLRAARDTG